MRSNRRRYEDGCAAAHALDLIGERWALLVVRELALGPRRFTDLRAGLPTISPNVLAQRLDELEAAAIVRRRRLPPPAAARVYELTEWGAELEPILRDLGRWAARSPTLGGGRPMSTASVILSLRTMFDPAAAGDFAARVALVFDGEIHLAVVAGGRLAVGPVATAPTVDARLAGDRDAFAAVVYGGRPLDAALADGLLALAGDRAVVDRFVRLFPLPAPAPAADVDRDSPLPPAAVPPGPTRPTCETL
ncbi:transcriptional regulator [Siculibacillus lacustris]|uniref:Transcriptional regulator n=1 Tax=Siculibacillus lacustris TaxID=1549641 RepID=A0A4Q9VX26_9HYPH|nr:helix-turn-helix domain-containing protein [Siculibacillus lacustris]TBW39834.1 transcriptional regulator [Siculibacillus lacustris]